MPSAFRVGGVLCILPTFALSFLGLLGLRPTSTAHVDATIIAAVFSSRTLYNAGRAVQPSLAALVWTNPERKVIRRRHCWARRGFGTRYLWSNLIPPFPIRSLSDLALNQRDSLFLGPEFLARANGMRIRLVILVDHIDSDSGSVGWQVSFFLISAVSLSRPSNGFLLRRTDSFCAHLCDYSCDACSLFVLDKTSGRFCGRGVGTTKRRQFLHLLLILNEISEEPKAWSEAKSRGLQKYLPKRNCQGRKTTLQGPVRCDVQSTQLRPGNSDGLASRRFIQVTPTASCLAFQALVQEGYQAGRLFLLLGRPVPLVWARAIPIVAERRGHAPRTP